MRKPKPKGADDKVSFRERPELYRFRLWDFLFHTEGFAKGGVGLTLAPRNVELSFEEAWCVLLVRLARRVANDSLKVREQGEDARFRAP